ncbi:MAG: hypothetical protein R3Y35_06870 [Clostridia bacterium]
MKKNKEHKNSKIAVIVIAVLTVLYAVFYGALCLFMYKDLESPIVLIYGIIPIAILVGIIIAVKMRIKEIDKGEIDEARKY